MIIRNIIVMLVVGLLLSPSLGLAAESPPHEALFHAFIESIQTEGIMTNGNAERAGSNDTGAYWYAPIKGAVLIFIYEGNELSSCIIEIDENTYAFNHLSEILACFIFAVDDQSTTSDEAQVVGTYLIDTLSETAFPITLASQIDREHVQLELSKFFLSESRKEDESHKTMWLVQLTASF